ncbi:MAG: hypothetical protein VSS75_031235 [Candidatus Parabeggiatoa sp.]|nr:hypothetical protein [Candidatus Parabeggiatoa sp.]
MGQAYAHPQLSHFEGSPIVVKYDSEPHTLLAYGLNGKFICSPAPVYTCPQTGALKMVPTHALTGCACIFEDYDEFSIDGWQISKGFIIPDHCNDLVLIDPEHTNISDTFEETSRFYRITYIQTGPLARWVRKEGTSND